RAQIFANRALRENLKLFAGSNFQESNAASLVLTYCPNYSRDLFFANCRRFAKFAKIRSCENLVVYSISEEL
ncbi:MAG: hypothetical protein PV344_09330, partial [Anaplasma sp.]|nr:hypothetical protein [Anaplasma sp.]